MTAVKFSGTILIFLFTSLFIYYCNGQSYLLSSLPVEKELSSRQVTSIFQDGKGFIWIGTEDGLNLYNANSIKIFKHDVKNKNSLLNNYIQNICEDKSGNNSPDENEIFGQYLRSPDIAMLLLGKWSLKPDQYHSYHSIYFSDKKNTDAVTVKTIPCDKVQTIVLHAEGSMKYIDQFLQAIDTREFAGLIIK